MGRSRLPENPLFLFSCALAGLALRLRPLARSLALLPTIFLSSVLFRRSSLAGEAGSGE